MKYDWGCLHLNVASRTIHRLYSATETGVSIGASLKSRNQTGRKKNFRRMFEKSSITNYRPFLPAISNTRFRYSCFQTSDGATGSIGLRDKKSQCEA
jgi:hypothetical protein